MYSLTREREEESFYNLHQIILKYNLNTQQFYRQLYLKKP